MPRKIEISHRTIIFTIALLLLLWFLSRITDILLMVFVSFILMSALNPLVNRLERFRLPRALAIILIFIIIWGTAGVIVASLIPGLIDQTSKLIRVLPSALNQIEIFALHQQEIGQQLLTRIGSLPENLLKITIGLFSNLLSVLTTLVISFYLLLYYRHLDKYVTALIGKQNSAKVVDVVFQIERRLGSWIRGELVLMFVVGLMTYFGLVLLGIEIALPLAILAGILEIVPNIGPFISSIPAVLVALTLHPFVALATAALYFIVQFLENHLLVPNIMQRAVGVNPLVSIIALMIGFRLAGPAGAILALPLIIIIQTIGIGFFSLHHLENLSEKA